MQKIISHIQTPFFIIVGTIIVYLGYKIKSSDPTIAEQSRKILEREQNAFFLPNIDIPNDFFKKPSADLPFNKIILNSKNKNAILRIQTELLTLLASQLIKPIQDLSNIDLKEKFGVRTFENILQYEQNYNNYIINLNSMAQVLINDNQFNLAEEFLLEAVKMKSENSKTYINLINIYANEKTSKLSEFINEFKENNTDESKYYVKKTLEHYNSLRNK